MNPRAPQRAVNFGDVAIAEVFDLRGFNLNTKLDIDPDFLKEEEHDHEHHDHVHGEHCDHPSHQHGEGGDHAHHHHHDDDVKSFVFKSDRQLDPAKLEDFLGAIVNIYGPRMLRYKGVLNMKGTDRKVIFQGVHQLDGQRSRSGVGRWRVTHQQNGLHRHRTAQGHPAAGAGAVSGVTWSLKLGLGEIFVSILQRVAWG
jgi:Putative GTPases (G3E family)